MITLKEKKMLLKMKTAMGESTEELQSEIEAEEKKLAEQSESRKAAFSGIFTDLSKNLNELAAQDKKRSAEQQTLVDQLGMLFNKMVTDPQVPQEIKEEFVKIDETPEEVVEPTTEQVVIEQPKPASPVDRVVAHVKETTAPSMFVQPNPPNVDKDIKAIQNKLKLLEGWVGKISMNGPGGGAVWLRDLDDIARASVLSASDGDVLKYNASTKKWEAGAVSANGAVGTLHQVTTAGNTTNNSITANGVHSTHFAANLTAGYTVSTGEIAWNPADLTFDMGMANGVTLQVGQEQYIKVKAASNITNGQAVMFAGVNGEHILAAPCNVLSAGFRPEWFIGIATQNVSTNGFGYITTFGKVHDINTLAWTEGDILYVNPAVVGGLTNVEPEMINIMVAAVTKRAGGDGHLMVRPSWRPYLTEINGVVITSPANGQVLSYISSSNTWVNRSLSEYQTTTGLSANVATLTSNNTSFVGSVSAANVVSNSQLSSNLANYQTTAGLSANVATLTSNNSLHLDGIAANQYAYANQITTYILPTANTSTLGGVKIDGTTITITNGVISSPNQDLSGYQTNAGLSANVATLTSNNTSFVGTVSAANVVSNTQLQSNLANYQTTAGLSANVATLTSNNALYLGGTTASGYAKLNANATFTDITANAVTSNAATAFIAGDAAASGVALQMPNEGALRNMTNGFNNMYFDVSNGGSTHGAFVFRSSNSFTSVLNMSTTAVTFNSGATVTSQSPALARTPFNSALDTVVTVDNLKYRISNQGGVFPQIASASGSQVDVCYDVEGVVSGNTPANAQNSGYLLLANGTWLSIYSTHGMDSRGDRVTAHITDKAAGKIYRATFMKTNNSSNADGYNIIVERIL